MAVSLRKKDYIQLNIQYEREREVGEMEGKRRERKRGKEKERGNESHYTPQT